MDSVGPRLTGSPGHRAGNEWAVAVYRDAAELLERLDEWVPKSD